MIESVREVSTESVICRKSDEKLRAEAERIYSGKTVQEGPEAFVLLNKSCAACAFAVDAQDIFNYRDLPLCVAVTTGLRLVVFEANSV